MTETTAHAGTDRLSVVEAGRSGRETDGSGVDIAAVAGVAIERAGGTGSVFEQPIATSVTTTAIGPSTPSSVLIVDLVAIVGFS